MQPLPFMAILTCVYSTDTRTSSASANFSGSAPFMSTALRINFAIVSIPKALPCNERVRPMERRYTKMPNHEKLDQSDRRLPHSRIDYSDDSLDVSRACSRRNMFCTLAPTTLDKLLWISCSFGLPICHDLRFLTTAGV